MISYYSQETKIGKFTIFEENGAIIRAVFPVLSVSTNGCRYAKTLAITEAFKQLTEFLDGKRTVFDLKLEPKGTDPFCSFCQTTISACALPVPLLLLELKSSSCAICSGK